jgi:hypothetical protein
VTSKTPNAERQLGDVTATHTIALPFIEVFNVELKTGYSKTKAGKKHRIIPWDLLDLIDGKGQTLLEFWEQTEEDAIRSERIPMLIFKRDYHTPVVCLFRKDIDELEDINGDCAVYPNLTLSLDSFYTRTISLYNFSDFFEWLCPETVKLLCIQKSIPKPKRLIKRHEQDNQA